MHLFSLRFLVNLLIYRGSLLHDIFTCLPRFEPVMRAILDVSIRTKIRADSWIMETS